MSPNHDRGTTAHQSLVNITHSIVAVIMFVLLATIVVAGCSSDQAASVADAATSTGEMAQVEASFSGNESFQNRCAVCHGEFADGTATGPPLVNRLYENGHHPNFTFHNAVNNGVTAHHWNFGDMPPIPNVAPQEIDAIICHVRDLQRAEGIAAGDPC